MKVNNQKILYTAALLSMTLGLVSCDGGDSGTTSLETYNGLSHGLIYGTPVSREIIIEGNSDGVNANDTTFIPTVTGQYSLLITTGNSTSCNYEVTEVGKGTAHIKFSPRTCRLHERMTDYPFIAGNEYVFNFKAFKATSYNANFRINSEGTSAINNPKNTLSLTAGTYKTVVGTLIPGKNSSFYRVNLPSNATLTITGFPCGGNYTLRLELFDFGNYALSKYNPIGRSNTLGACTQSLPIEANRDYLVVVTNNSPSKTFFEPGVIGIDFDINITL